MPQDVEAFVGTTVNLPCSADGFPLPSIMWYYQGTISEIMNSTNSTFTERTIVINNLMLSNGGDYTCEISSIATTMPSNMTATVAVIESKIIELHTSNNLITHYLPVVIVQVSSHNKYIAN